MKGWWVASKGLRPLPRRRGSALALGCGEGGRVVLPLARAAAVSTGLRIQRQRPELPRQVAHLLRRLRAVGRHLLQEGASARYQGQEWLRGALWRHAVLWLGRPFG